MTRSLALAATVVCLGRPAFADPGPERAERVSELRAEVDELAYQLEAERRRARDTLSALRAERAELERQLRLERIRRSTLDRLASERTSRLEDLEAESQARRAPLREAVEHAQAYVKASLPFRREARLRSLEAIAVGLTSVQPDPGEALARLFRFVEEEEALTREIGRSQQPVDIEGTRQLVDVARVGMALLYFRTLDGRVGSVRRVGGAYRYEVASDGALSAALRRLFDALDENRSLGLHRLVVPTEVWERLR